MERKHIMDGTDCWCNPRIIKVKGKRSKSKPKKKKDKNETK